MANIFNKLRDAMLGDTYEDEEDYVDEYDDDEYEEDYNASSNKINQMPISSNPYSKRSSNSKIVNIHTNVQMEVVITTPESLEEAGEVCDDLKAKKTVVVNLEKVEHETAQRISDFLCGACYALDGSIRLISDEIFIIGPLNVDISGQFKEELKASGIKLPYTSMWK